MHGVAEHQLVKQVSIGKTLLIGLTSTARVCGYNFIPHDHLSVNQLKLTDWPLLFLGCGVVFPCKKRL
jgi:hypothetical protein